MRTHKIARLAGAAVLAVLAFFAAPVAVAYADGDAGNVNHDSSGTVSTNQGGTGNANTSSVVNVSDSSVAYPYPVPVVSFVPVPLYR